MKQMQSVIAEERYAARLVDEKNAFVWSVFLPSAAFLEDAVELFHDLERYASMTNTEPGVEFEFTFPTKYPHAPPFVRVVRPRFKFHTGHVTIGGSICTHFLTPDGWTNSLSAQDVITFIHHDCIVQGGGRVDFGSNHHPSPLAEYSIYEAKEAFNRVKHEHGW
tara:strand:+ start:1583 stop:2074 length:492 start_codon:yes stop_codon:yes gene_type:complete